MHVDGSCHCGAVRFEAEIEPRRVGICHCTDCQTFSSSAFRVSVAVPAERFRLLEGTLAVYTKTADSGTQRGQAFCANCGTHVYATAVEDAPKSYSVRVGTLAQRAELHPVAQVWCRSALPWLAELNDVYEIQTQ